jgi:predicted metal-dependent hydrolase
MPSTPRYAPEIPLPPYSYVSGHWPHPLRDPAGHSFGITHPPVVLPDPSAWHTCREYCYAVDLWNAGYYWEAHEQWEALWHAAGRTGATADFFKSLIKLAAAGVKVREARPEGVLRHLTRAEQLWQQVLATRNEEPSFSLQSRYWGLQWQELLDLREQLLNSLQPSLFERAAVKQPVLRVWAANLDLA